MPIDKLMTSQPQAGSGLNRLGKLHKGGEKIKKKRSDQTEYEVVGRDLHHFRMVFAAGYEHLSADFAQMYGAEPTSFPVMLNADTVHEALDAWYEQWDGSGTMLHRCTGTQQAVAYNGKTGFYEHDLPCAMPACSCKEVARLELILPDFIAHTGEMGTITLETHADADIRTLIARLTTFQVMYGTLRGVPLILFRAPREVGAPEVKEGKRTGKRVKVTRSMIDIKVDPVFAREKLMGALTGAFGNRSLPHASSVVVSQEQAAPALGSGQKRIGTDEQQTITPQLPAQASSPLHWTAEEKSWSGFIKWSSLYGYDEPAVLRALEEVVRHDIKTPTAWTGDKVLAMAAIIALAAGYDAKTIDKYAIKGITSEETVALIRADAKTIAEARHQALADAVIDDPFADIPIESSDIAS